MEKFYDYYDILGVKKTATKEEIEKAYDDFIKNNQDLINTEIHYIKHIAKNVLVNDEEREKYDKLYEEFLKKKNAQTTSLVPQGKQEVIQIEDDEKSEEVAQKGKKVTKKLDLKTIVNIILVGTAVVCMYLGLKSCSNKDTVKNKEDETTETNQEQIEVQTQDTSSIEIEENADDETEEQTIEIDMVNNEDYMDELAESIWEKVETKKHNNSSYAQSINCKEDIFEMIRWAHHSDESYTGEYIITNGDAYSLLTELQEDNDFYISSLFEGLNSYENIKSAETACKNINQNNDNYDDERLAYEKTIYAVQELKDTDYSESIALSIIVDTYIDNYYQPTMLNLRNEDTEVSKEYSEIIDRSGNSKLIKIVQDAINTDDQELVR